MENLENIAKKIVDNGRGILAADESANTIKKRFESINVESNEKTRCDYRETLFSTNGVSKLVSHEHATLRIFLDGSEVAIAAEIGIDDASCDGLRGIHTHDGTGKLHIETPRTMEAPVGAFFDIWGETFNENQILNSVADEDSEVVMYVNGELNDEYGSYAMKNNDVIEIHYRDKSD